MKNDQNNASLGLSAGDSAADNIRSDAAPREIDVTTDRLGEILAARRHQLGLRIEEIAEDIKIRADYLRWIEQEAFDKLPTVEYGRLFLKSYAERLGLNVNDIYALYDVHHRPAWEPPSRQRAASGETGFPTGPTPRMPAAKPIPGKVWAFLVVAIIAIAVVILVVLKMLGKDGAAEVNSPRIEQTPPVLADPAPTPVQQPVQDAQTVIPDSAIATDEIVIDAEMLLVLTFDRETWVKLVADNDTIASGIYYAGQKLEAKGLDRFTLSLGHTDGVQASVNGAHLKPFSAWTRGFGGMVITADSVASWMIPEQTTGGPLQ
jgi:cytoskeletal protein RodZ